MERLDLNDIDLLTMVSEELGKILDEIMEDLDTNPSVKRDLVIGFNSDDRTMTTVLALIYAAMEPDVRRRLDNVVEMYREACA